MSRYIDAEQVEEMLKRLEQEEDDEMVYLPSYFKVCILDEVPIADVKEINHGRWIMSADGAAVFCM